MHEKHDRTILQTHEKHDRTILQMHEKILKFTSRHSNSTCTTIQDMVKCLDKNKYYATVYFIG